MANRETASNTAPSVARILQRLSSNFSSNWRLHLLGLTGLSLSIASGWTTFDGINNFTNAPLLSALITFGIQGVMLVTAWLIGETLASTSVQSTTQPETLRSEILGPYGRGIKAILAHLPLWAMFLTCMATSVFFSFDSLFTSIFPPQERARAANIRVTADITGLMSDLKATSTQDDKDLIEKALSSPEWQSYETTLKTLTSVPNSERTEILSFERKRNRDQGQRESALQKSLATMRAKLETERKRKSQLETTQKSLEQQIATQDNDRQEIKKQQRQTEKAITLKRAEARAETSGVGDSGKAGEGPRYRAIKNEIAKLEINLQALSAQTQQSVAALNKLKTEYQAIADDIQSATTIIATLNSEIASQSAKLEDRNPPDHSDKGLFDELTTLAASLSISVTTFRQKPTAQSLATVQANCTALKTKINVVPTPKPKLAKLNCNPGAFSETLSQIENHLSIKRSFEKDCSSQTLPKDTNALFAYATKCIQDAALPASTTKQFREKLHQLNLNRDDQAHRFVVTWNAFLDGNRLAYLALTIAAAIDSLVFMSGLFGASVSTSPLKSSPKAGKRSAAQLDKLMADALSPNKERNANLTLRNMTATSNAVDPSIVAEIDLNQTQPADRHIIHKALTAGSTIGLVEQNKVAPLKYTIREQLFEYLSSLAAKDTSEPTRTETLSSAPSQLTRHPRHGHGTKIASSTLSPSRQIAFIGDTELSETERNYANLLLENLDLEHANSDFLDQLSPNYEQLDATTKKWRRTIDPVNQHLRKAENALRSKIERLDSSLAAPTNNNNVRNSDIEYLDKEKIWARIIFAQTLALLRNHLRRIAEEAQLVDATTEQQLLAQNYQKAYEQLTELIEDPGLRANVKNFTSTLESINRLT